MRDRLIELLNDEKCPAYFIDTVSLEKTADFLLENGVLLEKPTPKKTLEEFAKTQAMCSLIITLVKNILANQLLINAKDENRGKKDGNDIFDFVQNEMYKIQHMFDKPEPNDWLVKRSEQ